MTVDIMHSERLLVRSVCDADLETLHALVFSDTEVMSQAFSGNTFSREESADFFAASFDHEGNGRQPGVLVERSSGKVVGFAGLMQTAALGEQDYEIGFVLARQYWGQGYASEIGRAQIKYGFESVGCARLLALVSPQNDASSAVLRKLGMKHHSTIDIPVRGARDVYIAKPER